MQKQIVELKVEGTVVKEFKSGHFKYTMWSDGNITLQKWWKVNNNSKTPTFEHRDMTLFPDDLPHLQALTNKVLDEVLS